MFLEDYLASLVKLDVEVTMSVRLPAREHEYSIVALVAVGDKETEFVQEDGRFVSLENPT
jgi:hypothetical protein